MSKVVRDVSVSVNDYLFPLKAPDVVKVAYGEFTTVFYSSDGSELRVPNEKINYVSFGPNKVAE